MEKIHASKLLAGLVPAGKLTSDPEVALVTTDSREVKPGCIFVAFPGERFDGHDFAARALEQGAEYVVVNHPVPGVPEEKAILCPDSYHAMMVMGANYRSQYHPKMVGVTGSVGKTTTKQMTYAALSGFGETIKTEGNQNNELGMPRTLMRLESSTEYAVIEMGMSGFGEISAMTNIVRPDVAIITNIGVSHIEKLGSREGILKAKLELLEGMKPNAPVILNADNDMLRTVRPGAHRTVFYSIDDPVGEYRASDIVMTDDSLEFTVAAGAQAVRAKLPCTGRHNVYNALAACAAGKCLGIDIAESLEALKGYVPSGMRQRIVKKGGITFIEDCYNASPDSQAAALAVLGAMKATRRIAVIGDMLELGSFSEQAHREVGEKAAQNGIDAVLTYGERALLTAEGAKAGGVPLVRSFSDKKELSDFLLSELHEGDAVLFKASRGMKLEDVIYSVYSAIEE